jgi:hypothetical protein
MRSLFAILLFTPLALFACSGSDDGSSDNGDGGTDSNAGGDSISGGDASHDGDAHADVHPGDATSDGTGFDAPPTCTPAPKPTTGWYVSPTGSKSGDGSEGKPWDLATALAGPSSIKPGDTIWLRGGTYTGSFTFALNGADTKPIIVSSYPGEWAVLDAGPSANTISVEVGGSYVVLRDFEIMCSNTARTTTTAGSFAGTSGGLDFNAPNSKLIDVVIHDTSGNGFWTPAPGSEVYGLIAYNNGWDGPDRSHGHGLYIQNKDAPKTISESIVFDNFSYGFHAYTESGSLVGIHFVGNVFFQSGAGSATSGLNPDMLVGGLTPADDILVQENMGFRTPGSMNVQFGYGSTDLGITLTDNYFAGGVEFMTWTTIAMTGNTIIGTLTGVDASKYPGNTVSATAPTANKIFVRKNAYEAGRGNVIVYNWAGSDSVDVDLSSVLTAGANYEVHNAQNYLAGPVKSGVYDGKPVTLPMTGLDPAQPIGLPGAITDAEKTGKTFNVFVVRTPTCP